MKIRLAEIPAEGRTYHFDRVTGELNSFLEDLLGKERPYDVDITIRPIGNAYEMRGKLKARLSETCSKCGYDFDLPIEKSINEILFEEDNSHRKGHSVHGNQSVDFMGQGPSMVPIKGEIFYPGDFAHEVIALEEPFYPTCGPDGECTRAEEVEKTLAKLESESEAAVAELEEKTNPFAVLKNLDVQKKKN